MTIADHCITLLRARSPRTLEDLAEACVAAGATRAQSPAVSVRTALEARQDEVAALADGRYDLVLHLLDGRWLTTRRRVAGRLSPSFDLRLLQRLLVRGPLPLAGGGGELTTSSYGDGICGPSGWLPRHREALVGVRVAGGALESTEVELDETAAARGRDLADRVRLRLSPRGTWWPGPAYGREHEAWRALVQMMAEDDDLLRAPVAPLSELLPEVVRAPEAQVELGARMTIRLPRALQDELSRRADEEQLPLDRWLTVRLQRLASVPASPPSYWQTLDDVDLVEKVSSFPG